MKKLTFSTRKKYTMETTFQGKQPLKNQFTPMIRFASTYAKWVQYLS